HSMSEHDLLQVIAAVLPSISLPAERNNDVLQEIESEQSVLHEQAAGWHGFVHGSFQEYFVAAYLHDHHNEAELLRHCADYWWEEVLLLYLGMTSDASLFLQELYSQRSDLFATQVLLAGRCLATHPTVREPAVPTQIIEQLFELVLSAPYSVLRQEAF